MDDWTEERNVLVNELKIRICHGKDFLILPIYKISLFNAYNLIHWKLKDTQWFSVRINDFDWKIEGIYC